jgi:hypothetical protein
MFSNEAFTRVKEAESEEEGVFSFLKFFESLIMRK